ncbi:MAG: hypothetical protein ABJA76_22680 [Mucilaginibacter sp.]
MRYLFTLLLFFVPWAVFSQTFNYYHNESNGKWQCITILIPPGHDKEGKIFYNSSVSSTIEPITETKSIQSDTIAASYVRLGSSDTRYIMVVPSNGMYLILSDDKQLFTTIYTLDSTLFNPVVSKSVDNNGISNMLKMAVRLLLF